HQKLGRAADQFGEAVPPPGVQFGEHVVQCQYRFHALGTQQLVRGQPQRQRERPRLAVARVPLRRQLAQRQREVVAVRTDQRHTSVHFGRSGGRERVGQRLRQGRAV